MSNDPNQPISPDTLQSGIRGRVQGVTRIGPRVMLLAILVVAAVMGGIMYGMLRAPKAPQQLASTTVPIVAPPQPSIAPHFGQNVEIVESPPPETPAPAVLMPPTPPPLPQDSGPATSVALQTSQPQSVAPAPAETVASANRGDVERQRRSDEEKVRVDTLKRAYEAPILTANAGAAGAGAGASPAQVAVTSAQSAAAPAPPSANNDATAGSPGGANAGLSYLSGPTGQYAGSSYTLPTSGSRNNTLSANRYAAATIFELTAGSVIPAALVTGIDSEQAGIVTGQVREDVYDAKTGRYMLIPRGSRLLGVYKSDVSYGKSRVLVAWQRLIFPDTSSIDLLNMTGADVQGGAGLGGKVDNHTGQLIGATLLSSILAAGVAISQPRTQTVVSSAGGTVAIPSAGQVAAQGVGQNLADIGQSLIQKNLNIPPVVHVPKGYPFLVVVDRDIVFPGPYGKGS